jgi:hypothetical protein
MSTIGYGICEDCCAVKRIDEPATDDELTHCTNCDGFLLRSKAIEDVCKRVETLGNRIRRFQKIEKAARVLVRWWDKERGMRWDSDEVEALRESVKGDPI